MCGRITQHRAAMAYAREMGWELDPFGIPADDPPLGWNIPPGTRPWLMHRARDGGGRIERLNWGYRAPWAADKGIPMAINARIEKAATGPYFRNLWRFGRAVIPADGWYEWTGDKGHKQPWYIRLKSDRPMFMAAIANLRHEESAEGKAEDHGFVIVTAAAEQGLVDVHDRRPVVFASEDAALWMDLDLSPQQAEQLARSVTLPPERFTWYPVSTEVNKASNNHEGLIKPLPGNEPPGQDHDQNPQLF